MVIWGVLAWWYTDGWRQQMKKIKNRLEGTIDFFSIGLLLSTLFSPYRQISAGNVRGPINVQFQAFFDKIISRLVGMVVRLIMIMAGSLVLLFQLLSSLLLLAIWALLPVVPLIGFVLWITGWLPWKN